jgi:serine phosphatase RsbU (regulator of sigma subunit)
VAARYLPGASGLNVGGDWYDVVSLPDNRTGVAMGDVVGRGVKAATVMGQLRTAFRAYAHDGSSPESVVGRLDRLMSSLDPDHFSTMVYLVWDPTKRVAHTVLAGHPPPLLIDGTGRSRFLEDDPSVPLGTVADFSYGLVRTSVDVGSTLVLYTDGLVEQEGGLEQGLARLEKAASHPTDNAHELCDRILKSMLRPDAEDDVAVVVLRFLGETEF